MNDITMGRKFYNDQIAFLEANDVDGLISNHYNADAALIGLDFTVEGHEALRQNFRNYLSGLGHFRLKETTRFNETEDTIFFEATITGDQGDIRIYDAMVMKGGKISRHFTGIRD